MSKQCYIIKIWIFGFYMGENQSPGVPQTPQCKALNRGATIVVVLIPYAWNGPGLYESTCMHPCSF